MLYGRLGLPAAEVARIVGKSVATVRGYMSDGRASRKLDEAVLVALRAAWREKAHLQLAEIVAHLQDEGVEIDLNSLEEHGPVKRDFWRPSFLGRAALWQARQRPWR